MAMRMEEKISTAPLHPLQLGLTNVDSFPADEDDEEEDEEESLVRAPSDSACAVRAAMSPGRATATARARRPRSMARLASLCWRERELSENGQRMLTSQNIHIKLPRFDAMREEKREQTPGKRTNAMGPEFILAANAVEVNSVA